MPGDLYFGETFYGGPRLPVPRVTPGPIAGPPSVTGRNPFTYPAWDLLTMSPLDALPYGGVQFGQQLNQPGSWAGSLLLSDPGVQKLDWQDASRPSRTLLCVDLAGVVVWGGILWTRRYNDTSYVMTIGAMEVGSYFQQRLQAADYSSTWAAGADPMAIARQVVQDAQAVAGGSIAGGITLTLNPVGGSGQTVTPAYAATQLQTIDSIVATLSQMGFTYGFDYSFDVAYLAGTRTPGVTMNFWYPRQGRTADQSQITIMHKQTSGFTYDEDGTQQANSIWETGSGSGGIQPADAIATIPGYPLLEKAINHTQVTDQGVLVNIAAGDLGVFCYPVTTPSLTVPLAVPDKNGAVDPAMIGFGQFNLGDDLIHRIDPLKGGGENACPRFPNGETFEWRINGWACGANDQGVPTLLFDLGIPPLAQIPPPAPPIA